MLAMSGWGQTSTQDFGTGTGSQTSSTGSTSFIPNPTSGTTWARAGATVPNAPIVLATASNPLGTTGTYLRAVASASTSVSKFSPWVGYNGSTEFYTSFKILFGDASAGSTATSGIWTFYQGAGVMYSDANDFAGAQVFTGLRFTFGSGGALALSYRGGASWINTGLSPNSLNSATVYTIEIVGNNKSSGTINYTYNGVSETVAVQTFDLYVNGTKIGNDLARAALTAGNNITSGTFIGISSVSNVANIFVDDVVVYNSVPAEIGSSNTPLITVAPTTLSGFTYVFGSGPSAEQSFTLVGSDLDSDITITPPTNYEISETSESGYTSNPIALMQSGGVVANTSIYVRLKAGLAIGNYDNELVILTSTDADNKTVTCSGSVTSLPTITFYFRGPSWMNNNPHNPQIWGPYNGWTTPPPMAFDVVPGWWFVTVTVADAAASIEYQSRFSENGVTKYQKAFGNFGANATYTTTTGEIWIDASVDGSFTWQGNDFYLAINKITETQPIYEPESHVTNTSAIANSSSAITVSWTDSDAAFYLIKGSDVGYESISNPTDGVAESDGGLVKNVAAGIGTHQFTGLDASTTYYFKIFSYNGAGTSVNYKTDGTIPAVNAVTLDPSTYIWIGDDNASWQVSTNWNPDRTTPANSDILQFNDGTTKTVTSVPVQTIGKLLVTGNTNVTLQAGSGTTLTISGSTGDDLVVESGSQLNISGLNALSISLSSGATGSVGGSMTFAGAVHKLLAADASGITFNSGSVFTAGISFSGNAFGTSSLNSVIFASGSVYIQIAGSNPFGAGQPNSVVVFQTGSLYSLQGNTTPAFSGRTYADFEIDFNGIINASGSATVIMNNLTVKQGTLNFNMTGTPGHSIKGSIEIMDGATLNFSPSSAGTVNLNGTSLQLISGSGTLSAGTNSTIVIDNSSGVRLNRTAAFNNFTIMPDSFFDIWYDGYCTIAGTLTNNAGATGLMIKTDATGTGSLIHSTASVTATMERFMNDAVWTNWKDGWHFLGSPVANQAISPAFTTVTVTAYDFYLWNEPTNEWVNFKNQSGGGGTAPFFDVVNGSNNFTLGRGYMAAYDAGGVKSFSGALNVADVPQTGLGISAGNNNSWHLLGNPFSSALTWDASTAWGLTNIAGVAKIWNEANQSYTDLTSSPSTVIPATNGFMVQVSAGTGSLTIPAAKRVHSSQAFYKSTVSGMMLTARSHTAGNAQEARIVINPDATNGFDLMYDSEFLAGHAPAFYCFAGEIKLSTNSLPELSAETEIPFNFIKNEGNQFSIEASGIESIFATPYLVDLKTGTSQNLAENPVYNFTSQDGDAPARFLLKFSAVGIPEVPGNESLQAWVYGNILYVMNAGASKVRVEVYNIHGQLLMAKETSQGLQSLPVNVPPGTYLVKMTSEGATAIRKISIQ